MSARRVSFSLPSASDTPVAASKTLSRARSFSGYDELKAQPVSLQEFLAGSDAPNAASKVLNEWVDLQHSEILNRVEAAESKATAAILASRCLQAEIREANQQVDLNVEESSATKRKRRFSKGAKVFGIRTNVDISGISNAITNVFAQDWLSEVSKSLQPDNLNKTA